MGAFITLNAKKPSITSAISIGVETALTNTGWYNAVSSSPTTAALIPQLAPAIFGLDASDSHAPCKLRTNNPPGKNTPSVAMNAPSKGLAGDNSAPKNAAMENIGPGTA